MLFPFIPPKFMRDFWFLVALLAGFAAWLLPIPQKTQGFWLLPGLTLAEEIIFRYGLQHFLHTRLQRTRLPRFALPGISLANIAASLIFSAVHLVDHTLPWAAAVFIPSLIFGAAWDRYESLVPCWVLHAVYNMLYFYRPF